MKFAENQQTELKREYTDDIKRSVVAFVNDGGGDIYIGVEDDGQIVGVSDPDDVSLRCVDSFRNGISPDVTMFMKVEQIEVEGEILIHIEISSGANKPYYLKEKGLKPSGVLIRVGTSDVPASEEHIRQMIRLTDGEDFIDATSLEQNLTFLSAQEIFAERGVAFSKKEFRTMKLVKEDGRYSNLALLLSDQCPYSIKVAVFEGTSKNSFRDRREFKGSLFSQLNDASYYINLFNRLPAKIKGLDREERYDYPPEAIREVLLNALIHRDYSYSGSILVNIYDDRIEVVSLGGIPKGLSLETIMTGISQARNESLADVFYRLRYVEAFGTGIPRINDYYAKTLIKPTFFATSGSFSVTLPNMNYLNPEKDLPLSEKEKEVLDTIREKGPISREEIMDISSIGKTRCYDILTKLSGLGLIEASKRGRKLIYSISR